MGQEVRFEILWWIIKLSLRFFSFFDFLAQNRTSSARWLQNKVRGLTTPRSSKPPSPNSVGVIAVEIKVSPSFDWTDTRLHSWKSLCPRIVDVIVCESEDRGHLRGWGCVSYSVVVRYIQDFVSPTDCERLKIGNGKKNCGKLKMYCSEYYQWLIHFNSTHGTLYWHYSLPDPQNCLNFQKLWVGNDSWTTIRLR